ncbi:MAG: hypothetical protein ACRDPY_07310 [Streptosporangiaceae bacterium]
MGEEHGLTPIPRAGRLAGSVDRPGRVGRAGSSARPERPRRQEEPGWLTVGATTIRLWLERHRAGRKPSRRRQIAVAAVAALVAMGAGAGITEAITHQGPAAVAPQPGRPANPPAGTTSLQLAAQVRDQAAGWIAQQVSAAATLECDPTMCAALQAAGVPAARLLVLQPGSFDPLGATVIVATQVVRSQFGARLASVYAPLVIASFGSGANRIDIRAAAPEGSSAFEAQLASDRQARIEAGRQLLNNKNVQATSVARQELLQGDVDPRLLVTLSALASKMSLRLIAFDDLSPGASPDLPLRGAEIGAAESAGLSAILAFLEAQQTTYQPAQDGIIRLADGKSAITVRFDAPGPMGLSGP